jgi:hypothetical protein
LNLSQFRPLDDENKNRGELLLTLSASLVGGSRGFVLFLFSFVSNGGKTSGSPVSEGSVGFAFSDFPSKENVVGVSASVKEE